MAQLPQGNPKIPEGINNQNDNPLKELALLFIGVCGGLAVLVVILVFTVQLLAPYIPFSWERKLAPLVEDYIAGAAPKDDTFLARQKALQQLGGRLLQSNAIIENTEDAFLSSGVLSSDYSFHLIDGEAPNAFASFGGHIFVTDALLEQVSSENALAMVVAHEIAHIAYRHPIDAASRALVIQIVLQAVVGSSVDGLLGSTLSSSSILTLLSFNRDMELEADERALDILNQHYGTYLGADEFFRKMAGDEAGSAKWLEFVSTHPQTERRLAVIEERMQGQARASKRSKALTPLPVEFQSLPQESD